MLALQGDVAEHRAAFADLGVEARPVRRPADLDDLAGLVLPGGESTTISMLLDSAGLSGPLGERLADGMAAFGTCAGLILLAEAVSDGRPDQHHYGRLDLQVRRNGYGRQAQSFEADLAVGHLPGGPFHAVFIRAPRVERCGEGVEVLARLPGGDPVLVRQGRVLGACFHPELTSDRRLHQLFLSIIEDGRVAAAAPATHTRE